MEVSVFTAVDHNGLEIDIDQAVKGADYFCKCCGAGAIPKQGRIRIHHFAHEPNSFRPCSLGGESPEHRLMKRGLRDFFEALSWVSEVKFEVIAGQCIADLEVSTPRDSFFVECQVTPMDMSALEFKLQTYTALNKPVMYVVHPKNVFHSGRTLGYSGQESRINAWVRALHACCFGRVLTWDFQREELVPVHFDSVTRWKEEYEGAGGYSYDLRETRLVTVGASVDGSSGYEVQTVSPMGKLLTGQYRFAFLRGMSKFW